MPKLDIIDSKIKNSTIAFLFILWMFNKSTIVKNINVFNNLNIYWLRLIKKNSQFDKLLII